MSWREGMWARMWQWSPTGRAKDRVRISVAHAARGTGSLTSVASPPRLLDPRAIVRDRGVVAVMNGDYFEDVPGGAVPMGPVVVDREVVFAPRGWSRAVATGPDGYLRTTHVTLDAVATKTAQRARAAGTDYPIAAVNDPLLTRRDIVLFTPRWSATTIPRRAHAVTVVDGRVTRIAAPGTRVTVPARGYVLASTSSKLLTGLTRGDRINLDTGNVARDQRPVTNAAGHGGSALRNGELADLCSEHENLLRPRSALAWNDQGDTWLLTASSGLPDPPDGIRVGGSTKRQLAQIAQRLGATDAVIL
ncbi:MAG: phosphodiester glycosidase family protein, partial [bacterium]